MADEHMIAAPRHPRTTAEAEDWHRICREMGGIGFTSCTEPGRGRLSWFAVQDTGQIENDAFERRLLARLG